MDFQDAFTLGFTVRNFYQVAGSPLGTMSCDTSLQWHRRFAHLHYKALPDVSQMMKGMLEFKKSMEVHVRDVPKENLQGDYSPHVASPQIWNNSRGLRFKIGNLMYASGRKPSMA